VQNFIGAELDNSSATAGQMAETKAVMADLYFNPSSGDITADEATGVLVTAIVEGAGDVDITSAYGFKFDGVDYSGGAGSITNEYGFYFGNSGSATNTYAFYSENDNAKSRLGTIERYKENVVALADDSTPDVTVDYNTSQIHTYTLEDAKEFRFDNIPTGGTVTLIITQSQGGSHTATFVNGADSTAVKFAGGAPTITTADGSIDVVTVFNDGTNLLGNIAQDFKSA